MFSSSAVFLALLPAVAYAHIGLWNPAALDFEGDGYSLATPLSEKSFDQWWFHGNTAKSASAYKNPLSLPAGSSVTVELACEKSFSSYGKKTSSSSPCPADFPSMHASDDSKLLGCGLAIAYKSKFEDVKPEDFTVFSVNHKCVKDIKTSFEVPKGLPSCEGGNCICAWFWQGQNSANEMYMTGFTCNVEGGASGASLGAPKPPVYCPSGSGCVEGPKQPLYWANDNSNIKFDNKYEHKPSYNDKWGFKDGAQNDIFGSGSSGSSGNSSSTPKESEQKMSIMPVGKPTAVATASAGSSKTKDSGAAEPSTTLATRTKGRNRYSKPTESASSSESCSWEGHCKGAVCSSSNDCSGSLSCNNGVCGDAAEYS